MAWSDWTNHSRVWVRKLHSKIIIFERVGFFLLSLMVKVRGRSSNRNTVKHAAEKWPKNLGWWHRGRFYVTGARCQEFKAAEWSWIRPGAIGHYGRSRTNWFQPVMNTSNRSHDLAWLWGGTTDVTNARTGHFSAVCLSVFLFTSDLHHRILRKKIYQIRAYDFGVQFYHEPIHNTWSSKAFAQIVWKLKAMHSTKVAKCAAKTSNEMMVY